MNEIARLLVELLPGPFRREFGDEVLDQIEQEYAEARARGLAARVGYCVVAVADLIRTAIAERIRPTWVDDAFIERDMIGGGERMMTWIRDLRLAGRSLRRTPGFSLMVAGTLGLAIGANAAIFTVVNDVLLAPLPFAEPDRVIHIEASAPGSDLPEEFGVSNEFFLEYAKLTDVFDGIARYNGYTATVRTADRTERAPLSSPSVSLFTTLGVEPILGRLPTEEDDGAAALLSHSGWMDWFGGDEAVLGRSVEMAGQLRTVVGVMGPDFVFPFEGIVAWLPNTIRAEGVTPGRLSTVLAARLGPGVTIDMAKERMDATALRLPELYGGSPNYARMIEQHRSVARPMEEELRGWVAQPLRILLGSLLIVLLVACANVTNLFLVRAERRRLDYSVRRAIGAGRLELARAQLAEILLLAGLSGLIAMAFAWLALPVLVASAPQRVPGLAEVAIGAATLFFTFLLCASAALLCGLVPVLRAAASGTGVLGNSTRGGVGRHSRGRDALVALQTALALVLLIGSGLLARSFQELRAVDPGYDMDDLFSFQIAVEDEDGMVDGLAFARFHLDFMEQLRALPGVERVGLVNNLPLNEAVGSSRFRPDGDSDEEDAGPQLSMNFIGGDYFATMGIEVLRGRTFTENEHLDNPGHVVISARAAELLWPGEDPVGRQIYWPAVEEWETVIGVVEDVLQDDLRYEISPMVYFPMVGRTATSWDLQSPAYVMKTTRAEVIAPEVRALAREAAPSAPMYRVFTMRGLVENNLLSLSFTLLIMAAASGLALLLGTVGLYGVLSYIVAERTREIGVRMALGAESASVQRMVVVRGVQVVTVGIVIGAAVALGVTRTLGALLFGVSAADVTTFAVVSFVILCVGALASYVPARRASSIDPVEALRSA